MTFGDSCKQDIDIRGLGDGENQGFLGAEVSIDGHG